MKPCISGIWAEVHHKCWGAGQKVQSEKHGDYSLRNRIYFFQFLVSQISKVNYRKVLNVGNGLALLGITTVLCEFVLMYFIKVTFTFLFYQESNNRKYFAPKLHVQYWKFDSASDISLAGEQVRGNEKVRLCEGKWNFPIKKVRPGYMLYDYVKVRRTFPRKKCRPAYRWNFSP